MFYKFKEVNILLLAIKLQIYPRICTFYVCM